MAWHGLRAGSSVGGISGRLEEIRVASLSWECHHCIRKKIVSFGGVVSGLGFHLGFGVVSRH